MYPTTHEKVHREHRERKAYLYVRQSTLRQVSENTESTQRQYALKERAVALGWDPQQIVVIDNDLGQSGTQSADRQGFQQLVTEVSMGRAGMVLGLEVSRLARNSADWYRLIDLCSMTNTLILDEDGIYDPGQINDRLVLGLKGTLSEVEIHVLRSRMRGGILNKARRAELVIPLPVGFLYDEKQTVILDPDQQVQESVRQLFAGFRRTGSVMGTVREFREKNWSFPVRAGKGPWPGELQWGPLTRNRVNSVLHNPRYAGGFAYGQHHHRKKADGSGRRVERVPREQWYKLECHAHAGYLSWEEYEENQKRLCENAPRPKAQGSGAVREGPALLQGLAYCGLCGARLGVRYHRRGENLIPDYVCDQATSNRGQSPCQSMSGRMLDAAVEKALLEAVTPVKLELALAVQQEIGAQQAECDRLRQMQVERTRYEAGVAERRYKRTDPDNRLVAGTLEAEWNSKLCRLREAEQEYQRLRLNSEKVTSVAREEILQLAEDFPRIWQDVQTPDRERKRMARLLLEDVTITRDQERITVQIRFKGGAQQTIHVPVSKSIDAKAVVQIDSLLQKHHTYAEIAANLNASGTRTVRGKQYRPQTVRGIVVRYLPHRLLCHDGRPEVAATTPILDHSSDVASIQTGEFGGAV
jgi:DNA invertase Pin-like site-specific DNA recombinase